MKWKRICWILVVVVAAATLVACGPGEASEPSASLPSTPAHSEQTSLSVIVGFSRAIEVLTGKRPAAQWEDLGTVTFMGRKVPRAALLNQPCTR